jgi:hypothetical protein
MSAEGRGYKIAARMHAMRYGTTSVAASIRRGNLCGLYHRGFDLLVLGEAVCVDHRAKRGLTVRGLDWIAADEVSCAGDTVKEDLTARDFHSGVLGEVNWGCRAARKGPGTDPILAGGPCEDSAERFRPAIT